MYMCVCIYEVDTYNILSGPLKSSAKNVWMQFPKTDIHDSIFSGIISLGASNFFFICLRPYSKATNVT